jgi:ABC-type nickel/cobalt efflux system permease component RcnA
VRIRTKHTNNPLTFGLAMSGGIGLVLMMVALGVGVIQAEAANDSAIGMTFMLGLALLVIGVGGWLFVTRPFENFDDISQPKDTGHHHEEPGEVHTDEPVPADKAAESVHEVAHH